MNSMRRAAMARSSAPRWFWCLRTKLRGTPRCGVQAESFRQQGGWPQEIRRGWQLGWRIGVIVIDNGNNHRWILMVGTVYKLSLLCRLYRIIQGFGMIDGVAALDPTLMYWKELWNMIIATSHCFSLWLVRPNCSSESWSCWNDTS